jgi:hypothetical protein
MQDEDILEDLCADETSDVPNNFLGTSDSRSDFGPSTSRQRQRRPLVVVRWTASEPS